MPETKEYNLREPYREQVTAHLAEHTTPVTLDRLLHEIIGPSLGPDERPTAIYKQEHAKTRALLKLALNDLLDTKSVEVHPPLPKGSPAQQIMSRYCLVQCD